MSSRPKGEPEPDQKAVIAELAHELRTPLGAIATLAEVIVDERFGSIENEKYREYARLIQDSARHALTLVENMLQRAMSSTPISGAIDVGALVASCATTLQPRAAQAGLTLTVAVARDLPLVAADATSVRQILFNLLTNALKFTPSGGSVRLSVCRTADGSLALTIADTGIGMSREMTEASLCPAEHPLPLLRPGGGQGLGLQIVRTLATSNGATVSIASEAGKGTEVTVVFARDRLRTA